MFLRSSRSTALLGLIALFGIAFAPSTPAKNREGFNKFARTYQGGYSLATPAESLAGPGTVRIRASHDGRSARVTWINTFYTPRGAHRVKLKWVFRKNNSLTARSMDPRTGYQPAVGEYTLKHRRTRFTATASTGAAVTGEMRLVGGATLSINATITGLPDGDVTFGFSGSRKR